MVALDSHHYFESKHNFKTNVHSQMEWSVVIIEEPVEMCTFKTEAPARCIRGRRPHSFPTIKLKGYEGTERPVVIVSCVEDKAPYRNHPYELVGKRCKGGVCRLHFDEKWEATLENVGILATDDKHLLNAALNRRKELRIDPYLQGGNNEDLNLESYDYLESYDLHSFRLCFQVFIPEEGQKSHLKLDPVISDVIKAKSVTNRLEINHLSPNTSPLEGGQEVAMFCSNVDKNDVEVHFVHFNKLGQREEMYGKVTSVHENSGIVFQAPQFYDEYCSGGRIQTFVYLVRPSNGQKSPYWPFYYEAHYSPSATMKMTSAKSRRSPYPRNRTKSGTVKISEVEKIIMDLGSSLISDSDEEPRMSDIVLATPIEKLKVISDMTIATNQQIIREETIDIRQYEEELETQVISVRSHSLDCHDDSYKQMKFGPPLTEDRMFWVDRINIGQNL